METVTLFKENYHVELSDVDFKESLKLSALFSYFQDVANLASINLGFGIHTLEQEHGVAWVLMRMRVDIIRNPVLDEEITIETWPLEPKKLEFGRDYLVRDRDGNIIIRAVSSWVIMDIKERKLKRAKTIGLTYPENITERAIDCKLGKLKHSGELDVSYKKVIGYSDIDFNGHLNNSKYVDYIMDCFDLEEHKKYDVTSIEVNFMNEALPGDEIMLYRDVSALNSNLIYVEGFNEKNGRIVFKAQLKIVEKNEVSSMSFN
ncbi:MAG TPA: acyl-ACP thioesterase domain-containing protein [Candidatus Avamphibacillus sp.]|nr:acyl-ACP thioesterase domain-containing protein [Candidatus Avamphibacillus sp.]